MRIITQQLKKQLKKMQSNAGFTLLEILVVLTIMGFLIAMVAPRLAGISGGAVDTVCDTNQNRMLTYMSSYFEQTNRFPNKLTNLVLEDETNAPNYFIPEVSDQDPDNGAETLAAEFNDRNHFKIHILDGDEAAELKNMGIVKLLNLNSYDNSSIAAGDQGPAMNPVEPVTGVGVAMIGFGYDSVAAAFDIPTVAVETERGWGEPDWFGRIIFGMGPECSLLTSGIISNAAHCPGGLQNADNATYNDYNLVLPRLAATVARYDANVESMDNDAVADGVQLDAVAYDDEPSTVPYVLGDNVDKLRLRTFNISDVQETWQYATQCPEGHMYPEDDGEFWGIDFDADTGID